MFALGKKALTGAAIAAAALLGGCTDYGYGGGQVGLGYGAGGYYDDYYGGYSGYGYADGYGGYPGYGWFGGYYYPGSGYYVYDRGGRRQRWNEDQRRHWEGQRDARRDFRGERRDDRRDFRQGRIGDRQALQNGTTTPEAFRSNRQAAREAYRSDRQGDRAAFRAQREAAGGARGIVPRE